MLKSKREVVKVSVSQQTTVHYFGIKKTAHGKLELVSFCCSLLSSANDPGTTFAQIYPWLKTIGGKTVFASVPALISLTKLT